MHYSFVTFGAAVLLSACTTAAVPEYGSDHPANSQAPAAVWQMPGTALSSYKAGSSPSSSADEKPRSEQKPAEEGGDHAHHH
jgi:hypothetical protein